MVLGFSDIIPGDTVAENGFTIRNGTHLLKYTGRVERLTVPDGITDICDGAFRDCGFLVSVKLPESTEFIHRGAFEGCSSLKTVSVPECLISIGRRAFSGCGALIEFRAYKCSEKAVNRAAVKSSRYGPCIRKEAFLDCKSLKYADIPRFESIEDRAFAGCTQLSGMILPECLHSVGKAAFSGCTSLRRISLPSAAAVVSDDAFTGCTSLGCIDVSAGNHTFVSVEGILCGRTPGIPEGHGLNMLTVPEGKKGVLDIPDGISSLEENSLRGCKGITRVNIPQSVKRIGRCAFLDCTGLTEIFLCGSSLRKIDRDAFLGCDNASVYVTSADGNVRFVLDMRSDRELQSLEWNDIELRYPQVLFRRIKSRQAKIGIVLSCLSHRNISEETVKNYYRKYIFSYPADSIRYAIDRSSISSLEICLSCGAARKSTIDGYIGYSSEQGKTECTAFLMQYKRERFSSQDADTDIWERTDGSGEYDIDLDLDLGDLNDIL